MTDKPRSFAGSMASCSLEAIRNQLRLVQEGTTRPSKCRRPNGTATTSASKRTRNTNTTKCIPTSQELAAELQALKRRLEALERDHQGMPINP